MLDLLCCKCDYVLLKLIHTPSPHHLLIQFTTDVFKMSSSLKYQQINVFEYFYHIS
jgi:hypothetical protein